MTLSGYNRRHLDGLLQPQPAVRPLEVVPGEVAEDLLDGGDQGLLFL